MVTTKVLKNPHDLGIRFGMLLKDALLAATALGIEYKEKDGWLRAVDGRDVTRISAKSREAPGSFVRMLQRAFHARKTAHDIAADIAVGKGVPTHTHVKVDGTVTRTPIDKHRAPASSIETFTPAMCTDILENHSPYNYRPLRDSHVKTLSNVMARNEMKLTGSTMVFDRDGNLINGQHRAWACVMANVPFTTCVLRNVDRSEVEKYIDQDGLGRDFGQILGHNGASNSKLAAAAVMLGILWRDGARTAGELCSNRLKPTPGQMETEYLRLAAHQRFDNFRKTAMRTMGTASPTNFMLLGYVLMDAGVGVDAFQRFVKIVAGIDQDYPRSPAFALHKVLIDVKVKRRRLTQYESIYCVVAAWNRWFKGEGVTYLTRGIPDAIPEIETTDAHGNTPVALAS